MKALCTPRIEISCNFHQTRSVGSNVSIQAGPVQEESARKTPRKWPHDSEAQIEEKATKHTLLRENSNK